MGGDGAAERELQGDYVVPCVANHRSRPSDAEALTVNLEEFSIDLDGAAAVAMRKRPTELEV